MTSDDVTLVGPPQVRRIARFGLTTPDAGRLAAFYEQAFGCRFRASERADGAEFRRLMAVDCGAQRITLSLGEESIELLQFDSPGIPCAADSSPLGLAFQHFALVVSDMRRALIELERAPGWSAISSTGPQHLPQRSGGVTAFKFRDPDGHPLEFLEFPASRTPAHWRKRLQTAGALQAHSVCGIDHSAISVTDTTRSIAYFRQLGFEPIAHSSNQGIEQERLDGIAEPCVEVTALALAAPESTPHLELLCYRTDLPRSPGAAHSNDAAATRLVLEVAPAGLQAPVLLLDPDGHRLQLIQGQR